MKRKPMNGGGHIKKKLQKYTTLTITGRICVIWPVSSKTMTEVEMVWVTAPANAAAPTIE